METRAKQDLTRLGTSTSLKLLKRQLHEWRTLLQNQKQVRQWTREKPIRVKDSSGPMAMFSQRAQQLTELSLLAVRQSEERQQLHQRHQQEAAELDQVLVAHQPRLAGH
jgi:hypothetical protein